MHFHTELPVCLKLRGGRTRVHRANKWFFSSVAYADTSNCSNLKMRLPYMWCCTFRTGNTCGLPFYNQSTRAQQELFTPNAHLKIKCCKKMLLYNVIVLTLVIEKDWFKMILLLVVVAQAGVSLIVLEPLTFIVRYSENVPLCLRISWFFF